MSNIESGGTLPLVEGGDAQKASASAGASPNSLTSTIRIEGQEFELERSLADDDKTLRNVLRPHYAALENALITREEKDGRQIVTIVKRAQHKGSGAEGEKGRQAERERLEAEPERFNPALALAAELGCRPMDLPLAQEEIERATAVLDFSHAEIARMDRWEKNLAATAPAASPSVPTGF